MIHNSLSGIQPYGRIQPAMILASLLLLLSAGGCQTTSSKPPEKIERGYIYYLDGAGGGSPLSNWARGVKQGFIAAGYEGTGEMFAWETGLGVTADQVASVEYKRSKADELARKVTTLQRDYPAAPVSLIGLSAGTVIAVFALEALPPQSMVETAILLSGSLSSDHDLTAALRHVRGKLYVFTSSRDAVLQYIMPLAGTADRVDVSHGSIGVDGVRIPSGATPETRQLYSKIVTVPWNEEFARLGNAGGHTDSVNPRFVQAIVAPLAIKTRPMAAPKEIAGMVANPDYDRWAGFATGSWTMLRGFQVVDGKRSPLKIKATLVSRDGHHLIVDREFSSEGVEVSVPLARRFMVAARIMPGEHPVTAPQRSTSNLPPQTIKAAGKELVCAGRRLKADGEFPGWGSDIEATIYTNEAIPGGLARIDLKMRADGRSAEFSGQVEEFHAVRD